MRRESEKILKMVADGQISSAEGDELLKALKPPKHSIWSTLINPFERLPVSVGLLLSVVAAGIGLFLASVSSLRFDGALDVHLMAQPVPFHQAVVDQVVAWGLPAVLLWLTSLVLARQGRFIDFLITVGVARVPLVLLAGLIALFFPDPNAIMQMAFGTPWHPTLWLTILCGLTFLIWFFALLFNGYRVASGLKRRRLIGSFIWVLVIAEIGSKILLGAFPLGLNVMQSEVKEPYVLPGESHAARAEAFLDLLENDEFNKAWRTFDPRMAKGFSETTLTWTWRASRWKLGRLESVDERRVQARDGSHIVDLICSFEDEQGVIRVVFDSQDRVSGLWLLKLEQALPAKYKSPALDVPFGDG
jgi:hypothetical protein